MFSQKFSYVFTCFHQWPNPRVFDIVRHSMHVSMEVHGTPGNASEGLTTKEHQGKQLHHACNSMPFAVSARVLLCIAMYWLMRGHTMQARQLPQRTQFYPGGCQPAMQEFCCPGSGWPESHQCPIQRHHHSACQILFNCHDLHIQA